MAAGSAALGAPPEDNVFASHLMVDQDVIVSARITGIVETITVDRGSTVTQGQTLATLDPRALDADVREAKEDMDLRKAEYDRAQVAGGLQSRERSGPRLEEGRSTRWPSRAGRRRRRSATTPSSARPSPAW